MSVDDKTWPKPGDRLAHVSRKTGETFEAVVLQVDEQAGTLTVRVGNETFTSLSAAAASIGSGPQANISTRSGSAASSVSSQAAASSVT